MAKVPGAYPCSYCNGNPDDACSACDAECDCLANEDEPEQGKVYALTGTSDEACILNGNTWAESEAVDTVRA